MPEPSLPDRRRARALRLLGWLRRHPLVWLVPLLFYLLVFAYLAVKMADAPQTEFIYDV